MIQDVKAAKDDDLNFRYFNLCFYYKYSYLLFFNFEDDLNDSKKTGVNFSVFLKNRMVHVYDDDGCAYF